MDQPGHKLFSQRLAHWTSRGEHGVSLYERLAHDEELPAAFDPADTAAILGVLPKSLKKQRIRSTGPDFIRVSARTVRYPRDALCMYIAGRYVKVYPRCRRISVVSCHASKAVDIASVPSGMLPELQHE